MSLHRFLAYVVLGCWIAVTAVVVCTALQWFAARGNSQIRIQRSWDAQKEASSDPDANFQRIPLDTAENRAAAAAAQRHHERVVLSAEAAGREMSEAIQMERIDQAQFWPEFAVWGALTLLGAALFAERRESVKTQ